MAIQKLRPESDEDVDSFFTTAKEYKDSVELPPNAFSPDTTTRLDTRQPMFHGKIVARSTAEFHYATSVIAYKADFVIAKRRCSHFITELNKQIEEGVYNKSVRLLFSLDLLTGNQPYMGSASRVKTVGKNIADGVAALALALLPPMLQPTGASIALGISNFKASELVKKGKLVTYSGTIHDVIVERINNDLLVIDMEADIEYKYRTPDKAVNRTNQGLWGMKFGPIPLKTKVSIHVQDIDSGLSIAGYGVRIGKRTSEGGVIGVKGTTNAYGDIELETTQTGLTWLNGELILWEDLEEEITLVAGVPFVHIMKVTKEPLY